MQGEPIKVGHHSEGRHRRDVDRMDSLMHTAATSSQMATHHTSVASNIRDQLDRSIYRDDVDELEQLESKLRGYLDRRDRDEGDQRVAPEAQRHQALRAASLD